MEWNLSQRLWNDHPNSPTDTNRDAPGSQRGVIEGMTLTDVLVRSKKGTVSTEKKKQTVALAIRHYVGQIQGSFEGPTFGNSRVHSDISSGNLMLTDNGQLAILDRG